MLVEPITDPDLPIVDSHHHFWIQSEEVAAQMATSECIVARSLAKTFRRHPRYLFEELTADVSSGHRVCATVYNEAGTMYRTSGPESLRSVGEIEFVNGVAAMAESGNFGRTKVCAGIVGGVDLRLGKAVTEVLAAHVQAGGGRYRGVRSPVMFDEDPQILGGGDPHVLLDSKFREGFECLHTFGLSFDALVLEPQILEVVDLARAFPETRIILNHMGTPMGVGRYAAPENIRFKRWRDGMRALSTCENVVVKLGGLGLPFAGFPSIEDGYPPAPAQLADEWKPFIESCIELFGVDRCMFESNFPVDSSVGSYRSLWSVLKLIVAGASREEKLALFSGTATRVYRLDI